VLALLTRAVVAACLLAGVAAGAGAGAATPSAASSTCFGAAERAPVKPCTNPSITVKPAVKDVDVVPSSPCKLTKEEPEPVCTFGTSEARAKDHIALIGDSHALHWRAAVEVVAKRNRWRGYSVTSSGCFFSDAAKLMAVGAREICVPWVRDVHAWFRRHPEVSTVFVSQNATTPVVVQPGQTNLAVKARGFRRAWSALPKTVKHVVVIRDTPDPVDTTFECVTAAIAANTRPGPACPTPRAEAMHQDTAVATVAQVHAKRYQSVDMTSYFCSAAQCFPAIGGLLVYRDVIGHITPAYSVSLGPFLNRKVRALMARW
jgi:hypothetical protein